MEAVHTVWRLPSNCCALYPQLNSLCEGFGGGNLFLIGWCHCSPQVALCAKMSFVYIPEFSAIIKCIFTFAVSGVFRTILKLIFIDTAQPGSIALMHCTARPVACHSPMYKLHSGVAQPQAVTLTTPFLTATNIKEETLFYRSSMRSCYALPRWSRMIKDTMDTLCHFQPSNGSEVLMQAIYTFTSELEDVRLHLSSAYVNTVCDSIP